jgi:diacylglycerol kinase family enzyme
MSSKKACIVADLRTGEHLTKIPDIVAVLAAAGWKTKVALKEYGGETIQLAQKATEKRFDLVIGYGGDGTLNAVLNGVVYAGGKSLAADIPGGTFNVWAGTIGVPNDPVKAALALVGSEPRMIDLGHVEVTGLTSAEKQVEEEKDQKKAKRSTKNRQYFLLNVGMGVDAKMMNHISKPLKYRTGPFAFDIATIKELPNQRPYPVEIQQTNAAGDIENSWQGEVWQVYISKVPLFGGSMQIETEARADDGLLYICLITANGPVKTMEQVISFFTQHKPEKGTTKYFRGKHFSIKIPASVDMHIDGSISKLEDLLHAADQKLLEETTDKAQLMVNYQFDIKEKALSIAIPQTYDGRLFVKPAHKENGQAEIQQQPKERDKGGEQAGEQTEQKSAELQQKEQYKITVIGAVRQEGKQPAIIVAGNLKKLNTDETQVVALRVAEETSVLDKEGTNVPAAVALEWKEGQELLIEGSKSKRGVIKASWIKIVE